MVETVVEAEVRSFFRGRRGDDVPAGPPAADVVDRREPARQVVRFVVRRRHRRDQPDPAGVLRQRGQQGQWLELAGWTKLTAAGERRTVGKEQRVELRILRELGQFDPVR